MTFVTALNLFLQLNLLTAARVVQEPGTIIQGAGPENVTQTTFWGPSGLIRVPSAYTAFPQRFRMGASFEENRRSLSANYGVIRDIEIGGAWIDRNDSDGKLIGNAKVRIQPANFRNVDIGIGVIDVADAINQSFYVVGSVDLIPPRVTDDALGFGTGLKVHAGYGSGVFRDHMIAGAELRFSRDFTILAEYDGTNTNGALRYSRSPEFSVQAGVAGHKGFVSFTGGFRF